MVAAVVGKYWFVVFFLVFFFFGHFFVLSYFASVNLDFAYLSTHPPPTTLISQQHHFERRWDSTERVQKCGRTNDGWVFEHEFDLCQQRIEYC